MNTSKKGASKELLARKDLEAQGWTCAFKSQRVRFGRIDFANLFDLVMVAEHGHWYFCAVTHYRAKNTSYERCLIQQFKERHGLPTMQFWQWIWHPAKWRGRGVMRVFEQAHWTKLTI